MEIRLLLTLALVHLRIYVAGVLAPKIRGGELLFVSRRSSNLADFNGTGLNLEPGQKVFFLGWTRTRSQKPVIRTLPDWHVKMLRAYLESRTDPTTLWS